MNLSLIRNENLGAILHRFLGNKFFSLLNAIFFFGLMGCNYGTEDVRQVERIIFDTDVGGDIDDAGALAILHALASKGEIEFLAVGVSIGHEAAVPYVHAVNTWFGRPDLPIGTIKGEASYARDEYMELVVKEYPYSLTRENASDVVSLYRKILASQPDRSVTLVAVGPATNIYNLLKSGPDEYSQLSGIELMRKKIKFYGAGGNGSGLLPYGECGFNYKMDLKAASGELDLLPSDFSTVFAGGSGKKLKVGSALSQARPDNIIRKSYEAYYDGIAKNRNTWDQLRVLYASCPSLRPLWDTSHAGRIEVNQDRIINWSESSGYNHAYAYVNDLDTIGNIITELMLFDPRDNK